jgi:fibronectin-binding autotransporter adhesin
MLPGRLLFTVVLLTGLLGLMPTRMAYADTSLVVTTLADSGGGSLREAINTANAVGVGPAPATITFNISGAIALTSTLPAIDNDFTIDGSGHAITVSGNNAVRVMVVHVGQSLQLRSISITDGAGSNSCGQTCGGGIYNAGTLTVANGTFANNNAWPYGVGGGIYNAGTLNVTNSTFMSNVAYYCGGIYNAGTVIVSTSTFMGNNSTGANGIGGGICNDPGRTLTVSNSTFANNSATWSGGGIYNAGTLTVTNSTFSGNRDSRNYGGSLYNAGMLNVTSSIIAHSMSGDDCFNDGTLTGSHNLIQAEGAHACGMTNGIDGNIIGVDPLLGPLADNGGSTLTLLPLPGSPAINAGDNASCPPFDQRGVKRPQGAICDIGAVESLIWPRARLLQIVR